MMQDSYYILVLVLIIWSSTIEVGSFDYKRLYQTWVIISGISLELWVIMGVAGMVRRWFFMFF